MGRATSAFLLDESREGESPRHGGCAGSSAWLRPCGSLRVLPVAGRGSGRPRPVGLCFRDPEKLCAWSAVVQS